MKKGIIYKTTNLINGKIYIGQDSRNDIKYLGSGTILKLAIESYGKENFIKETIEECDINLLNEREIYWISYFNSINISIGYNCTLGGEGFKGNHSDSTKQKMRNSHTGKQLSAEHKKKISESQKGRIVSDDTKQKISNANKGKQTNKGMPRSEEWKRRISESNKGKNKGKIPWNKKLYS
jgi:group I intron endonuclease